MQRGDEEEEEEEEHAVHDLDRSFTVNVAEDNDRPKDIHLTVHAV